MAGDGLYRDDQPVIGGKTTALSSEEAYSFPATRSQTRTANEKSEQGPSKQVRFEEDEIREVSTADKPA